MPPAVSFLVAILLAGSVSNELQSSDVVPNEQLAIQIAQRACGISSIKGLWSARVHDGTWRATFDVEGLPKDCPLMSVVIRSADGALWDGKSFTPEQAHSVWACSLCAY